MVAPALSMTRLQRITILGAMTAAIVGLAAGARARSPITAAQTSVAHTAATQLSETKGVRATSLAAPASPAEEDSAPHLASSQHRDPLDWGNPYDLMLHGIPIGRTRDMR
jgi:hypothetical protein